ncbi:hypothetical protein [Streptococcus marmotae]|uniref:hypothetical protein n=1 Tax=Streptococcus marmotae TaxID=1825069 RepID=UPI00083560C5|nr:hypothetical protein [Streptococcus marmotae]QBX16880.1 hypothetical protein Javan291_0004 [Streptococcus phage Javan291]
MTTFTLTIDEKNKYIADYFKANNIDDSQLTFEQLLAILEEAEDYAAGMTALAEQKNNPDYKTYALEEVADELGIAL